MYEVHWQLVYVRKGETDIEKIKKRELWSMTIK